MEPTEAQKIKMQTDHAEQFVNLVNASLAYFDMLDMTSLLDYNDPKKVAVRQYIEGDPNDPSPSKRGLAAYIGRWFAEQRAVEASGMSPVLDFHPEDFFNKDKLTALKAVQGDYQTILSTLYKQ